MHIIFEEMENGGDYLIHYKTPGAKNGHRRYQSYLVAPSGASSYGIETGEAAKQRARIEQGRDDKRQGDSRPQPGRDYPEDKFKNKAPNQDSLLKKYQKHRLEKKKDKWAKSYKSLNKHADAYSTNELRSRMDRLEVTNALKRKAMGLSSETTQKGAEVLKNILSMAGSVAGLYNAGASAYNAYNAYKGTNKKPLPNMIGKGTINGYPKPGGETKKEKKSKGHSAFDGPYLEHFGTPGMKWYHRFHQSYKTAPTRSGKVGEEHFDATKQSENMSEPADDKLSALGYEKNVYDNYEKPVKLQRNSEIMKTRATLSIDRDALANDDQNIIDIAKNIEKNYEKVLESLGAELANQAYDDALREPWADISRDDFIKGLGYYSSPSGSHKYTTGEAYINLLGPHEAEFMISDGGAYGDHILTGYFDPRTWKMSGGFAVEG